MGDAVKTRYTYAKWIIAAIALVIACVSVFGISVAHGASSSDYVSRASFSKAAECASVYIDNLFRTGNYDALVGQASNGDFKSANAGGGLGYVPEDSDLAGDGSGKNGSYTFNFFNPTTTKNSVTYSYSALAPYNKSVTSAEKEKVLVAFTGYARYGQLLSRAGLDEVSLPTESAMMRQVAGIALWCSWMMANASQQIIGMVYKGISYLNPLTLFRDGGSETLFSSDSMSGLRGFTRDLFNIAGEIGAWIVVPLLLALFVFMLTVGRVLFQARFNWTRARNLVVRIAFIVVGVPVMLFAFFGTAQLMADSFTTTSDNGKTAARVTPFKSTAYDYIILETLVDFQGWVESSNLNPPATGFGALRTQGTKTANGGSGTVEYTFEVSPETTKDIRALALGVNASSHDLGTNANSQSVVTQEGTGNAYSIWASGNEAMQNMAPEKTRALASDLIDRYRMNNQYLSTDYEAFVKSKTIGNNQGAADDVSAWFVAVENMNSYANAFGNSKAMDGWRPASGSTVQGTGDVSDKDKGVFSGQVDALSAITESSVVDQLQTLYDQYVKGDISWSDYQREIDALRARVQNAGGQQPKSLNIPWFYDGQMTVVTAPGDVYNITYEPGASLGLSTMSMYNYLNSDFTDSGITVQGDRATNEPSFKSHKAVSSIGSGVYGIMAMINAIVFLFAIGILGFVYGIGLLFTVLKNGLTLILQIPFAVMGWLRGIARAVLLFLGMLVEMLVCGYLYIFMTQVLALLPNLMTGAGNAVNEAIGSVFPAAGSIASIVALVIGTLILIMFILLAIRARAIVLGAINNLLGGIVERVVGASGGQMSAAMPVESLMKGAQGALGKGALLAGAALGSSAIMGDNAKSDTLKDSQMKDGSSKAGTGNITGQLDGTSQSTAEFASGPQRDNGPDSSGIENENRQQSGLVDASSSAENPTSNGYFSNDNGFDRNAIPGADGGSATAHGGHAKQASLRGDGSSADAQAHAASADAGTIGSLSAMAASATSGVVGAASDASDAGDASASATLGAQSDSDAHADADNAYYSAGGADGAQAVGVRAAMDNIGARGDGSSATSSASSDSDAALHAMAMNGAAAGVGAGLGSAVASAGASGASSDASAASDADADANGSASANGASSAAAMLASSASVRGSLSGQNFGTGQAGESSATSDAEAAGGAAFGSDSDPDVVVDPDMAAGDAFADANTEAESSAENVVGVDGDRDLRAAVDAFGTSSDGMVSGDVSSTGDGSGAGTSEMATEREGYGQGGLAGGPGTPGYVSGEPDPAGGGSLEKQHGAHGSEHSQGTIGGAGIPADGGGTASSGGAQMDTTNHHAGTSRLSRPSSGGAFTSRPDMPHVQSPADRMRKQALAASLVAGSVASAGAAATQSRPMQRPTKSDAPVTRREPDGSV